MAQGPTPPAGRLEATLAWFVAQNPILQFGERGVEIDTGNWKLGDGVTRWKALAYGGTSLATITGSRGSATAAVLASLLTALAARGEIIDSTTA